MDRNGERDDWKQVLNLFGGPRGAAKIHPLVKRREGFSERWLSTDKISIMVAHANGQIESGTTPSFQNCDFGETPITTAYPNRTELQTLTFMQNVSALEHRLQVVFKKTDNHG
jgi:hypothetical protein